MKINKNERGITLIALVITIIILLILAGVVINIVLGDNGLLKKTSEAVNKYKQAETNETNTLGYLDREWDNILNQEETKELENPITENTVVISENKGYDTLQKFMEDILDGKKTKGVLIKDVTTEEVTVAQSKDVVLDLNGHTITNENNNQIIIVDGTLKLENGKVGGTYTEKKPPILVNATGKIYIEGAEIFRDSEAENSGETIELYGELYMSSGNINNTNSIAICTYSTNKTKIEITGGTVHSDTNPAISNKWDMIVSRR